MAAPEPAADVAMPMAAEPAAEVAVVGEPVAQQQAEQPALDTVAAITRIERTISQMEDTFQMAMEMHQNDVRSAREQLAALKSALAGGN